MKMIRPIKINYLLIIFLLLVVSACRVGKEYVRPEITLPQSFNEVSFGDTSSLADLSWKEFFTDPFLKQLIEVGIKENHDLLAAVKRINIAEQQLHQARSLNLPQLDLRISAQYNRPSDNSLNGLSTKNFLGQTYIENYSALATLSWEADIWGKIRAQKEMALSGFLQSYEGAKAVQTNIVSNIAQGYFNLLMLDRQLEIGRRAQVLNDSFVVVTKLLKDAGLSNSLAVQAAEAQSLSTALLISGLEQSIALQENALKILTGQLPGPIRRSTPDQRKILPDNFSAGLPLALLSRRPDVRSSELNLVRASAQIGVAQANMYPALNLMAGGGLEAFQSNNWFSIPGSLFGLAAGSIVQPLLARRSLKTNLEVAKLQREEAVIRFRQSVLIAFTEVNNALIQIKSLKQQDGIALEQVRILKSSINNAQLLFRSDMANYLEVLTAQGNALQAELNSANIQKQYSSATVELYRALGGGWK